VGGYFIPYKSGKVEEELEESKKAVFLLGGKIEEEVKFMLPDSDISRSLIKIKKVGATPKKYPRKSGLATKEPIK
jgi:16S rRNA (guanine527-N7)-methyltransferase